MPSNKHRPSPPNQARRHFLGLVAIAGTRIAAVGVATMTLLSSPAHASGILWGRGRRGGSRGSGDTGNSSGSNGSGSPNSGTACLLRGTRIATPAGEMPIEDLQIGDLVETVHGEAAAVKWVGRHRYSKSGPAWSASVMPIRISRGALGWQAPGADLYVSPNHALFIDGVLIRAKELVNGTSIAPALPAGCETIEYFNIVLDTHEVVMADGAPVETFLMRERNHEGFANFAEYERLYSAERRPAMQPFAPIVGYEGGRSHLKALLRFGTPRFMRARDPIEAAREMLAARAELVT